MANKFSKYLEDDVKQKTDAGIADEKKLPSEPVATVKEQKVQKSVASGKYRSLRVNEETYQLLAEMKEQYSVPLLKLFEEAVTDLYQKKMK